MIHDTQSARISQKQDEFNIYAIVKTMCTPGYHHNGFVATDALGHMMYGYTLLVPCAHVYELSQSHCGDNRKDTLSHCFHDCIYISCKEKKLPRFKGSHQELSKYTMDDYPTVLLIKDNHESFPTYLSQTKNILNRETQGKVSLPWLCYMDRPFLLFKVLFANQDFLNINFSFWTESRCL